MKGYKAFENDLTCRGFQYEIGKAYTVDGKIGLCKNGFHFCRYPSQVFKYYDKESRMCLIEADGEIIEGEDKCVCSKITILREITGAARGRINYGDGDGYGDGYGDGDGYGYGDGYGNGDGYGDGNGNGYGYGDGDGDGYGYGNGYGNGYGDGYGYGIHKVLIFKED
ncbi:MAG: hypothetical protein IJP92_00710 [Lachnospiraceae bacterium]|nr:hypothetical protein [Lachnospiraceae bacterium]